MRYVLNILIFIEFLFLGLTAAPADTIIKGKKEELKGAIRINVQSNDKQYTEIIQEYILEKLPGLYFVDKMSDANVVLSFEYMNPETKSSADFKFKGSSIKRAKVDKYSYANIVVKGNGKIYKVTGFDPDTKHVKLRLLEDWESSKINLADVTVLQKAPLKFAKEFVKLWRKYN